MTLLPGWPERLREHAVLEPRFLDAHRVDLAKAATGVRHVRTAAEADAFFAEIRTVDLAAVALDTEYALGRPGVPLRSGRVWEDLHSQRPLCVSLAAWAQDGAEGGQVVRAVLDAREDGVLAALRGLLRLRVPIACHEAKYALFTLWQLGLDPDLHQLYDTHVAASAIDLGLGHRRARLGNREESESEQIRAESDLAQARARELSLVGQCARYGLHYPFSEGRAELRGRFAGSWSAGAMGLRELEYSAAQAEWTLRLYAAQQPEVLRRGLVAHLHTIEFPFAIACARMEWRGVHLDSARLQQVRDAAGRAATHYADELRGHGVDPPSSRDKFLEVMRQAGVEHEFRARAKPCTEDRLLRRLERLHPAVRAFRLHRHYHRLASEEWVSGALTGVDGRVHPTLQQLGSATGRITCSRPNLAALDRVLRPVVTAPPGRALVELDYVQIEVAVAAAEHGDAELIAAFNSGDVYASMAQRFCEGALTEEERGLTPREFKARRRDLRDATKTFVLAVIYNIQAPAIAAQFGVSVVEAEHQRERFLGLFPVLRQGLDESAAYGAARGYASVVSGLRRRREGRGSADTWTKNFLRNTPIQGSAAVVFKKAVIDLDRLFRGTSTWLVLPIHDALLIECDHQATEDVIAKARFVMEQALRAFYPALEPRIDVNAQAPECWNKDGHADSLERFIADPGFRVDGAPAAPAAQEGAGDDADADDGHLAIPLSSAFAERLHRTLGVDTHEPCPKFLTDLVGFLAEQGEERAAIYEYEAGLPRTHADERAGDEIEGRLRRELELAALHVEAAKFVAGLPGAYEDGAGFEALMRGALLEAGVGDV